MATDGQLDTRARYKSEFGGRLGPALHAFESRLFQLHRRWRDYDTLYCSDLRVEVLNKFAPSFFSRYQEMTFECVVMALARLTDPERTGNLENLSVAYLLSLVEPTAKNGLQPFVDAAQAKAEFAREWRNKRFAHNDLEDAVNQAVLINPVTHAQLDEAIVAINNFVEQLFLKIGGYSACTFDHVYRSNDRGGAHVLLGRLHEANKARHKRSIRIKVGDIRPEDWKDYDDPVWKDLRKG